MLAQKNENNKKTTANNKDNLNDKLVCPECGGENFAYTNSDVVCKNCGLVIDQIYDGTHFLEDENSRYGSPESRRFHSTFFKAKETSPGNKRKKYTRLWMAENSVYDPLNEQGTRILNILTKLGLSSHQKNDILFKLKKLYAEEKRKLGKVTNIFLLASAITIEYMKNKRMPVSVKTVVEAYKENGCKLSIKAVREYITKNNLNYRTSSAIHYIPKHIGKLRTDYYMRNKIRKLLNNDDLAVDNYFVTVEKIALNLCKVDNRGKKPSVFSVASVLLALKMVNNKMFKKDDIFTKAELARFYDYPVVTIRKHYNFLKEKINFKE